MDKYNCKWPMRFAQKGAVNNAVTLGQTTFYSESKEYVDQHPSWRRHEECHKRQWRRGWYVGFLFLYLWYQLRYGYERNPYEVEARKAERL